MTPVAGAQTESKGESRLRLSISLSLLPEWVQVTHRLILQPSRFHCRACEPTMSQRERSFPRVAVIWYFVIATRQVTNTVYCLCSHNFPISLRRDSFSESYYHHLLFGYCTLSKFIISLRKLLTWSFIATNYHFKWMG